MTGIRRTPKGWQAYIRVRGRLYAKRFPTDTTLTRMKEWREDQRSRVRLGASLPRPASTLEQDVRYYLEQVRSMPTYEWRKKDLALWVTALGPDRDRRTIAPGDLRAQLEQWRADGYAANTVNHRRTAMMALFSKLDGKSAPNPAKEVDRYKPEDRGPRGMPPVAILTILQHMRSSQTKARLELMAWTGWPQMTLERLEPSHIRWKSLVYVTRRKKGGGVSAEWMPLLPMAWTALRDFKRLGCWGGFSRDSMNTSWQRAVENTLTDPTVPKAVKESILVDAVPYDLRHSFGTLMALVTKDDTAVQKAMQHSDPRQTALYMKAAGDPRLQAGLWKVAAQLPRLLKQRKITRKAS